MIKKGDFVKIEDIGELAVCVSVRRKEYELELGGEVFVLPKRLCSPAFVEEAA